IWMSDQLALHGSTSVCLQSSCMIKVTFVFLLERIIGPEIAFDLAKDRRFVAFEDTRHLSDGHLCMPPALDLTAFLKRQLRASGSHAMFSCEITHCFLIGVALQGSNLSEHP
ncbi:MAG: hypothetical protein AAGA32_14510, partial [Pseudomonadota bacterium]